MSKAKAITLEVTNSTRHSANPDYRLFLNGQLHGVVHFNLRGYRGTIPQTDGIDLDIGEKPLSVFKKYIAQANRDFAAQGAN